MKKIDIQSKNTGNLKKLADLFHETSSIKCQLSRVEKANKIVIYDTDHLGRSYIKYEILLDEKVSGYMAQYDAPSN